MTDAGPTDSSTSATTAMAALMASAAVAVVSLAQEQRFAGMMAQLLRSPIRDLFSTPFKLSMAVDLMTTGVLDGIRRESTLYEEWLAHHLRSKGSTELEADWLQAERLAWDLHTQGTSHTLVGARGDMRWFRRLPLRIHDYGPQGTFSYQHKSLQEYLVAKHLFRALKTYDACNLLSTIPLLLDLPVLSFFGDICAGFPCPIPFHTPPHRRRHTSLSVSRLECVHSPPSANALWFVSGARGTPGHPVWVVHDARPGDASILRVSNSDRYPCVQPQSITRDGIRGGVYGIGIGWTARAE